jgi:CRP-like cAMP-binding protein
MALSPPPRNQLLRALPPDVLARLEPFLHPAVLPLRETLLAQDALITSVWFVESGYVSLVASLDDGARAEVGLIGREGMVGSPLATGVETTFIEAMVQSHGTALRMEAAAFRHALDDESAFRTLLLRYLEAQAAQTAQTAACNGRHGLEQRLARWLLMARDRGDSDDLDVTQEFLALMLCVQRPSVTVVAGSLQRAGLITYGRGHIRIIDRAALEAACCDCYAIVNRRFIQVLGE